MTPSPPPRVSSVAALTLLLIGLVCLVAYTAFAAEDSDQVFGPADDLSTAETSEGVEPERVPSASAAGEISARVSLSLTKIADLLPPRPPLPICELHSGALGDGKAGLVGTYVAGLAATPLSRRLAGQQLVRFDFADGRDYYLVVRLARGERRLDSAPRVRRRRGVETAASGRVIDSKGEPIEGARVWLAGSETETDAAGEFAFAAIPADDGMPLVIRKPGHAALFRVLSKSQFGSLHLHPLALAEGAELKVRFLAQSAARASDEDLRPWLNVVPSGERDSRLLRYPFFIHAIDPLEVDASGLANFPCLPRGAKVRVRAFHRTLHSQPSDEIRLDEATQSVVIHGSALETVRGTVVDANGKPIAGACLSCRPAGKGLSLTDLGWLLPPEAYVRGATVTRSAADGSFVIPRLVDGNQRSLLTVESRGMAGLQYVVSGRPAADLAIVLWADGERGRPRLKLMADETLGGLVSLRTTDHRGEHGPFPWSTDDEFGLSLPSRGLWQPHVDVDSKASSALPPLLILGETSFRVSR